MGVDFLKSKCAQFKKGWDGERLASMRMMFAGADATIAPIVTARPIAPHTLREGDEVLVHAKDNRLDILVDLAAQAVCADSPALAQAVSETGGYARGTVRAASETGDILIVHLR